MGGVVVAAAARTTLQNKRRNSKLPGTLNPTLKTPSLNSIVWRSEELIAVSFAVSALIVKIHPKTDSNHPVPYAKPDARIRSKEEGTT